MRNCPIKWYKVTWGAWIALFLLLGVMLLGASAATFKLPTKDGIGVEVILPTDVPEDITSQYMQVLCSNTQNLCVLRIFYYPERNFNQNPYLHFYDFIVLKDKKIVLGIIQYLNGNERYWKYESKEPEELSLEEFTKFVELMLSMDSSGREV